MDYKIIIERIKRQELIIARKYDQKDPSYILENLDDWIFGKTDQLELYAKEISLDLENLSYQDDVIWNQAREAQIESKERLKKLGIFYTQRLERINSKSSFSEQSFISGRHE
jgi:hypothetical protein